MKVYRHTPPMHTLQCIERKWTPRFCNVSDDPAEGNSEKMGDNLQGSLNKVTNVEAFEDLNIFYLFAIYLMKN